MLSYFERKFFEKFLWEFFFQILAKIKMTRNKNRLFGHLFFRIMICYSSYIYGASFIAKIRWKVVFCGWVPRTPPPLGTNGSDYDVLIDSRQRKNCSNFFSSFKNKVVFSKTEKKLVGSLYKIITLWRVKCKFESTVDF